jgi:hypothetical protein
MGASSSWLWHYNFSTTILYLETMQKFCNNLEITHASNSVKIGTCTVTVQQLQNRKIASAYWVPIFKYLFEVNGQGWENFENYMDKKLSRFWVYRYCKVLINISKNIKMLFTCDLSNTFCVYHCFFTHDN